MELYLFWFFNQECEKGKYGLYCKETCGACLNETACDHKTGSCYSGCKTGWYQTDKCDKGKHFFK